MAFSAFQGPRLVDVLGSGEGAVLMPLKAYSQDLKQTNKQTKKPFCLLFALTQFNGQSVTFSKSAYLHQRKFYLCSVVNSLWLMY